MNERLQSKEGNLKDSSCGAGLGMQPNHDRVEQCLKLPFHYIPSPLQPPNPAW